MQTVEVADQVVSVGGVARRRRDGELRVVDTLFGRQLPGPIDGRFVIVESVHGRFRKRLRDERGGHTVSAADIGHLGSGGELVDDTVKRGQPFSDEICTVSPAGRIVRFLRIALGRARASRSPPQRGSCSVIFCRSLKTELIRR